MAKPGLHSHRKFRRLMAILGIPEAYVRGHLECLWEVGYATGSAILGDSVDVELAAKWVGDDGVLTAALLQVRLIDLDEETGMYSIHDLIDHAPEYVVSRARKAQEFSKDKVCDNCGMVFHSGETHAKFCCNSCRLQGFRSVVKRTETGPSVSRNEAETHETELKRTETHDNAVPRTDQNRTEQIKEKTPLPPRGGQHSQTKPKKSTAAKLVPIPTELTSPDFIAAWNEWIEDRNARGKSLTELAARQQLAKLLPLGPAKAAECLRTSIMNGWSGIFPERFQPTPSTTGEATPASDPVGETIKRVRERYLKQQEGGS